MQEFQIKPLINANRAGDELSNASPIDRDMHNAILPYKEFFFLGSKCECEKHLLKKEG